MQYRIFSKTEDTISELGMGSAYLYGAEHKVAIVVLRTACEGGTNYFDLAAGDGRALTLWGEAPAGARKQVLYQIHFGADYTRGIYGWSLNLDTVKWSVEWQMLYAKQSPLKRELEPYQRIQYALDKPWVRAVLSGAQSVADVKALLAYEQAKAEKTDYSVIGSFAPIETTGKCVYLYYKKAGKRFAKCAIMTRRLSQWLC